MFSLRTCSHHISVISVAPDHAGEAHAGKHMVLLQRKGLVEQCGQLAVWVLPVVLPEEHHAPNGGHQGEGLH